MFQEGDLKGVLVIQQYLSHFLYLFILLKSATGLNSTFHQQKLKKQGGGASISLTLSINTKILQNQRD
jgi:hypothetical protein